MKQDSNKMEVRRLSQPQYWAYQFVCTLALDLILLWSYLSPSYTINSCCLKLCLKAYFIYFFLADGQARAVGHLISILLWSYFNQTLLNPTLISPESYFLPYMNLISVLVNLSIEHLRVTAHWAFIWSCFDHTFLLLS